MSGKPSSIGMTGGVIPSAGGAAVTEADGANVALGATTDAEAVAGNGSVIALLKRHRTLLGIIAGLLGAGLPAALVAGRMDISVGAFNAALPTGTNHIGTIADTVLAGRLDSLRRIDTLRAVLAGRLDSLRRVDTLRSLAAGRLDSLRRIDTLRYIADGRLDSVTAILNALPIGSNHIGRVAIDSEIGIGAYTPLAVTGTAAVNTGVTVTLPAVASQFHYITMIQVQKLYSIVGVAAGAGVVITTTNLPGGPAFTTEQLASAAGTVATVVNFAPARPLRSSVVNTNTTIVCGAQLQTIWRVNVWYYTAP